MRERRRRWTISFRKSLTNDNALADGRERVDLEDQLARSSGWGPEKSHPARRSACRAINVCWFGPNPVYR
jgi:hypothetical protein